jgi:hypothetical protein
MAAVDLTRDADDIALEWFAQLYRHVDWSPVEQLDELAARAIDRSDDCNVWFGVATRTEQLEGNRRGGDQDCAQLPALWVDIDVAGPNHADNERLPRTLDEATALVERFGLEPTAVVHTGGGLQAWWVMAEPLDWSDALNVLPRWASTWHKIAADAGVHVDSVFDLARVMRMPGTQNRKHQPTPVVIEQADWTKRYNLDELEPWLAEPPAPSTTVARAAYIGPERPGDAYNVRHGGGEVLALLGFTFGRRDHNGDEHWTRPGKDAREGTSATLYADDGHVTIWSDTAAAMWPALEVRRPYDPFGLLVATAYAGDFTRATSELRARGYGSDPDYVSWIPASDDPAAAEEIERGPIPIDWAEFWKRDRADTEWICYPILPRGRQAAIWAVHKTGKSLLSLDIAAQRRVPRHGDDRRRSRRAPRRSWLRPRDRARQSSLLPTAFSPAPRHA